MKERRLCELARRDWMELKLDNWLVKFVVVWKMVMVDSSFFDLRMGIH